MRNGVPFGLNATDDLRTGKGAGEIGWQWLRGIRLIVRSSKITQALQTHPQTALALFVVERRGPWYASLEEIVETGSEDGIGRRLFGHKGKDCQGCIWDSTGVKESWHACGKRFDLLILVESCKCPFERTRDYRGWGILGITLDTLP